MLPLVLLREGRALRGRDVQWMVDNTAALGSTVKGASGQPVLEQLIALFWILCYRFQIRVWLEYVDSEANWSDGISRNFGADTFANAHNFSVDELEFEYSWLLRSYPELWLASRRFE